MTQLVRRFIAHRPRPAGTKAEWPDDPASKAESRSGRQPVKPGGAAHPKETGGPEGPEPTRYGDWERKGICVDF